MKGPPESRTGAPPDPARRPQAGSTFSPLRDLLVGRLNPEAPAIGLPKRFRRRRPARHAPLRFRNDSAPRRPLVGPGRAAHDSEMARHRSGSADSPHIDPPGRLSRPGHSPSLRFRNDSAEDDRLAGKSPVAPIPWIRRTAICASADPVHSVEGARLAVTKRVEPSPWIRRAATRSAVDPPEWGASIHAVDLRSITRLPATRVRRPPGRLRHRPASDAPGTLSHMPVRSTWVGHPAESREFSIFRVRVRRSRPMRSFVVLRGRPSSARRLRLPLHC